MLLWNAVSHTLANHLFGRIQLSKTIISMARAIGLATPTKFSTMESLNLLAGEVAIVTGGASGIGLSTARLFLRHGARVILVDLHPAAKFQSDLTELGPKAHYEQCDVTNEAEVVRVWDKAFSLGNRLDIVFNNAGIPGPLNTPLDKLPMQDFYRCLQVNLGGMVLGTKHAARLMKPAKKGSIVCTASIVGITAGLGAFTYSISKAAVIAMVNNAAGELGPHGIRVNAVSPAGIATPFVVSMYGVRSGREWTEDEVKQALRDQSGFPSKLLEVEDVANAVLYLASDLAGYVSGHNLVLDAGKTTSRPPLFSQNT